MKIIIFYAKCGKMKIFEACSAIWKASSSKLRKKHAEKLFTVLLQHLSRLEKLANDVNMNFEKKMKETWFMQKSIKMNKESLNIEDR